MSDMNEPPAEMLCLKADYERMKAERNWYKAMMERPDACARTVCPRKLEAEQEVEKLLAELGMVKMGFTPVSNNADTVLLQAERDKLKKQLFYSNKDFERADQETERVIKQLWQERLNGHSLVDQFQAMTAERDRLQERVTKLEGLLREANQWLDPGVVLFATGDFLTKEIERTLAGPAEGEKP